MRNDLFHSTLNYLGRTGATPFFVVIGAMDGISFDEFHQYVGRFGWPGLLVEPIPAQFERLLANYEGIPGVQHRRFDNCAVAEHDDVYVE